MLSNDYNKRRYRPKLTGEFCGVCNDELTDVELAYGNLCNGCQRTANLHARMLIEAEMKKKKIPPFDIDDIIN